MSTLEEEEAQDEDYEDDGNEGTMTSVEEIDGTDEDTERYNKISDGGEDVDLDTVRGG